MDTALNLDTDPNAETLISSRWGIGALSLGASGLSAEAVTPNGTRLGGWLLDTDQNRFGEAGRWFPGQGGGVLVWSPWGLGVLRRSGSGWTSPFLTQSGTRMGDWLLNATADRFLRAGDLLGQGLDAVLAVSSWGLGVLSGASGALRSTAMHANGTRIGGWLLDTTVSSFVPLGDVDGDGRAEILVVSAWGLGVLRHASTGLEVVAMQPAGAALGGWTLRTDQVRFFACGAILGDGRARIGVAAPEGLFVLGCSRGTFTVDAAVANGSFTGGWRLETAKNRFGPAADYNGDGKPELLVWSDWGVGLLEGPQLTGVALAANGSSPGGWRINTQDNRFAAVGDFQGVNRASVLVTSPWGAGVLALQGGAFTAVGMAQNGTMLNGWRLNTADNDLEASTARSRAIVIEHNDWKGMIDALEPVLRRRGVLVQRTGVAVVGLEALKAHARTAGPSDRLFCYLAGHGSNHRDTLRDELGPAALHFVDFNNGSLTVSQLGPIFNQIAEQGCDLSVLDGSCNGGETVLNATGERYLCMATTGVFSPGLTGFPAMAGWLSLDPPQAGFGLWPEEPRLMASWLNGAIVRDIPWRFHQRLLRNDRGPLSSRIAYYRTAVDLLKILDMGGWNLMVLKCYLYAHIYPDAFNALSAAEQATYTNDTASYIAALTPLREAARPFINELRALLSDNTRIAAAAAVYHAGFTAAWRTLAGDASWDPGSNPTAKVSDLQGLSPGGYKGTAGFHRLVQDFLIDLAAMEECYRIQLSLLTQIDAALARDALAKRITLPVLRPVEVMPRSAGDIDHYQEYNRYVERSRVSAPAVYRTARLPMLRLRTDTKRLALLSRPESLAASLRASIADIVVPTPFPSTLTAAPLIQKFLATGIEHGRLLKVNSLRLALIEDAVGAVEQGATPNPGARVRI